MKEISDIIRAYDTVKNTGRSLALATVVDVKGSSYRRPGARMLVQDDGVWTGGISGGCLEGDALKKSKLAILKQQPSIVTYDTTRDDEHQIGVGLGCKGIIDVLMTPVSEGNPSIDLLRATIGSRESHILYTLVECSNQEFKNQIGQIKRFDKSKLPEFLSQEDRQRFVADIADLSSTHESTSKEYSGTRIFIEIVPPALRLVLFGGNYDIIPILKIGREIGYTIDVVANPRRLNPIVFDLANKVYEKNDSIDVDAFTAFILISHDYETDKQNLMKALKTDVRYIGMLGPAVRGEKTIDDIKVEGIDFRPEDHQRFFNPIGLDTGADNPEDIAISIFAEVRAAFNDREGGYLRRRPGTIYHRK